MQKARCLIEECVGAGGEGDSGALEVNLDGSRQSGWAAQLIGLIFFSHSPIDNLQAVDILSGLLTRFFAKHDGD